MSIRFLHIREQFNGALLGKGGTTVAYEVGTDNVVRFSVAKCSPRDNYCRKTGRAIATGRLNAGKEYTARIIEEGKPINTILHELGHGAA